MKATHPLESIFGNRSRIKVLRVLRGVSVPLNASQIAARTGLTHPAVGTALADLAAMGIVDASPMGRATAHWLVRENAFVQQFIEPAFAAEESIPDLLVEDLRDEFGPLATSVVLFGSYARADQDETSDVDLALVAADEEAKQRLDAVSGEFAREFRRRYGATLSPIIYDAAEASELRRRAPELQASLEREGLVICGVRPADWPTL